MLLRVGCVARLVPSGLPKFDRKLNTCRQAQLKTVAEDKKPDQNPRANNRSRKGASIENKKRRRGRPAWTRKPDDTPFRDGNRDRLVGLLTERAARTLCYYLSETNLNVHHWLMTYMQKNPIPRSGGWDDVSGETFLRNLLSMPLEHAKWNTGRDPLYDSGVIPGCGVDPRNLAQRVMAIRSQLSLEFIEDLKDVSEENSTLLRESLVSSLSMSFDDMPVAEKPVIEKGSSVSADKKQSSASADKKNSSISAHKKDVSVPADKKGSSVPADKKGSSVSAADKKDSAASAIASLKLSLESLPVAEKPVLKKNSSAPAGKVESPPVAKKPADKKDDLSSADKKGSPVSADKQDNPVSAGKKDSPVSTHKKDNPVVADKKGSSVSADKQDNPVSAGKKDSPVSTHKKDNAVIADKKGSPVSADKQDNAVSAGKKDSPVSTHKKDNPVVADKKGSSISADKQDNPVSAGKKDSPVSTHKKDNAVIADKKCSPVSADGRDKSVSVGKKDSPVSDDEKDVSTT